MKFFEGLTFFKNSYRSSVGLTLLLFHLPIKLVTEQKETRDKQSDIIADSLRQLKGYCTQQIAFVLNLPITVGEC